MSFFGIRGVTGSMITDLSALREDSRDCVRRMVGEITRICRDMKPRAPGSDGEREAAVYMAKVLETECGCREVRTERFREHPDAFHGYFRFSMTFDILCTVCFFLTPWLSLLFGGLGLLLFIFQFGLYRQIIDPLYPEREGTNVTAVRSCAGEVRQRILLNGHIDAAWEFPLNYRCGGIVFEIPGVAALIGVLFYLTLAVCSLCGAGAWIGRAALWGLLFLPFYIAVGCTYNPRRVVDGANDDLTGCWMGIELLRGMERLGIRPEHTEVGIILTGSEEAGLRGAKAWCAAHRGEYRDVPTWIVSFDTIHDPAYLAVNLRDLNDTVAADRALGEAFLRAAREAGVPCRKSRVPFFGGATDSAAFTQGGFRSVGVTGLNHRLEAYYHTRRDTWDNLSEEGLENCFRAAVQLVELAERGKLQAR